MVLSSQGVGYLGYLLPVVILGLMGVVVQWLLLREVEPYINFLGGGMESQNLKSHFFFFLLNGFYLRWGGAKMGKVKGGRRQNDYGLISV